MLICRIYYIEWLIIDSQTVRYILSNISTPGNFNKNNRSL